MRSGGKPGELEAKKWAMIKVAHHEKREELRLKGFLFYEETKSLQGPVIQSAMGFERRGGL